MYHRLNIKRILPTGCVYVLRVILWRTEIITLNSRNGFVLVVETAVSCEVRTESIYWHDACLAAGVV
jgi:hypothetical protein